MDRLTDGDAHMLKYRQTDIERDRLEERQAECLAWSFIPKE